MEPSLRQLRQRIKSTENARKLTRAMEMVSVVKLRQHQTRLEQLRRFSADLEALLKHACVCAPRLENPLTAANTQTQTIGLCVIASDTGLCSLYNHGVLYAAEAFLRSRSLESVQVVAVGRKAFTHYQRSGYRIHASFVGSNSRYSDALADEVGEALVELYVSKAVSAVYLAATGLGERLSYRPAVIPFLPLSFATATETPCLWEPGPQQLLGELLPFSARIFMRRILLESFTAEHQARAVSMGTATRNAAELLETLILARNKARQALITREIIEVVSASEALRS